MSSVDAENANMIPAFVNNCEGLLVIPKEEDSSSILACFVQSRVPLVGDTIFCTDFETATQVELPIDLERSSEYKPLGVQLFPTDLIANTAIGNQQAAAQPYPLDFLARNRFPKAYLPAIVKNSGFSGLPIEVHGS